MASVRKNALTQTKTSLTTLVPATVKTIVYDPSSIEFEHEFPYIWLKLGADDERDIAGTLTSDKGLVAASVLIRIVHKEGNASVSEDLEDVVEAVVDELVGAMGTFRALTPAVHVVDVSVIADPDIDIERDIGIATVGLDFKG